MEKRICEISDEPTPLLPNEEMSIEAPSDDNQCLSEESDDDSDNEEEDFQPIEEKYPPEACVGDYVIIDRVREYLSDDYRFGFADGMFEDYSGKVLIVKSREFEGEPDDDLIRDDGYKYSLVDIYGRNTGYNWASSMFSRIKHIEEVPDRTIDGLSRGFIAFQRVLNNYLISPNKFGLYNSSSVWAISLKKVSLSKRVFVAVPGDLKEIFVFPDEKSAIDFYKANRYDFATMGELF